MEELLARRQWMDAQFPAKPISRAGGRWTCSNGVKEDIQREPVFCPDSWGGYLIYRLYPETKVVVDDRHDLYGEQFFKQYLKAVRIEPGWATGASLTQRTSMCSSASGRDRRWQNMTC